MKLQRVDIADLGFFKSCLNVDIIHGNNGVNFVNLLIFQNYVSSKKGKTKCKEAWTQNMF